MFQKKGREAPELSLIASKIRISRVEKWQIFENFVGDVTNFVYSETFTVPTNNRNP